MRLIDADALYREYQEMVCNGIACHECKAVMADGTCKLDAFINNAPTVKADRPRGEWTIRFIEVENGMGGTYRERRWYCSACHGWQTYGETDFCPNCGADMRGADDA